MGKYFEALRKSETSKKQSSPKHTPKRVIEISTEKVEALKLDTTPGEATTGEPSRLSNADIDSRLVSFLKPTSPEAESFKVLRAKLLTDARHKALKTIMVSSPEPLDGKTLVAANLAVTIAHSINEHVLLVDCDLRHPSLHRCFGMTPPHGIREYLEAGTSLAPYLVKTPLEKLMLLPGGTPPPNPSELLSSKKMQLLVREVKDRYKDRYIIFDAPPTQFTAETSFLASMVDGVLLVVRHGKTSRNLVVEAIESLGQEKIIGAVFNANHESSRMYGYYYKHYQKRRQ
jgi:exopolysaccharide/PEP-CTERM locus tyrosine autokinase